MVNKNFLQALLQVIRQLLTPVVHSTRQNVMRTEEMYMISSIAEKTFFLEKDYHYMQIEIFVFKYTIFNTEKN